MVVAGDFKNGITFDMDGQVLQVIEFQHVKPGKGAAFVRTKLKNVITGAVTERTFNPTDKFENAIVERKEMQYLYNDGAAFNFMDPVTFEQMPISAETVGDQAKWLKENDEVSLLYAGEELISIEPQMFVELEVTDTDPGFAGNTATNATKPAKLETGAEIKVPLFLEEGERIKIDTRTGEYLERAKG